MPNATTLANLTNQSPAEKARQRDLDQEAYRLRCAEGLSFTEIAERLQVDRGTAWQRCRRAEKRAIEAAGTAALAAHAQQEQRLLHHYLNVKADYEAERTTKRAEQVLKALNALERHWGFGQAAPLPHLSVSTTGKVQVNMTDPQIRALMGLEPAPFAPFPQHEVTQIAQSVPQITQNDDILTSGAPPRRT